MRILVVEDDELVADIVQDALRDEGHAVDAVSSGADALWLAAEVNYDAVVLDLNIPAPDGVAVCRQLRAERNLVPVLMLTERVDVSDRVVGLDAGADDYLPKPFETTELQARVRALGRRGPSRSAPVLEIGDLTIDLAARRTLRAGTTIDLSPKEFALLELLAERAGDVLTRAEILERVWDFAYDGTSNVVDAYIRLLRTKVDRPFDRHSIETVRGVGYRLDPTG